MVVRRVFLLRIGKITYITIMSYSIYLRQWNEFVNWTMKGKQKYTSSELPLINSIKIAPSSVFASVSFRTASSFPRGKEMDISFQYGRHGVQLKVSLTEHISSYF